MSNREVKTRQTFEGYWGPKVPTGGGQLEVYQVARHAWNAALASVILPEGRFEVGDVARANYRAGLKPGLIAFVPDDNTLDIIFDPLVVRKVIELTTEEKLNAVFDAELVKNVLTDAGRWHKISQHLANGKTIDQLCAEHGVSTTKEDK